MGVSENSVPFLSLFFSPSLSSCPWQRSRGIGDRRPRLFKLPELPPLNQTVEIHISVLCCISLLRQALLLLVQREKKKKYSKGVCSLSPVFLTIAVRRSLTFAKMKRQHDRTRLFRKLLPLSITLRHDLPCFFFFFFFFFYIFLFYLFYFLSVWIGQCSRFRRAKKKRRATTFHQRVK